MMPDVGKVEDDSFKVETAFSGKAPRWNKEKISALIRLTTEKSTLIKRKFTPSLTSNDTYISSVINNTGTIKQCRMLEVTGVGILKVFFNKECKEIFWDLEFLSEVTGCRKTQVSDCTGSTV
jgi:hypothetical protein